jgi:hypothetical protein
MGNDIAQESHVLHDQVATNYGGENADENTNSDRISHKFKA